MKGGGGKETKKVKVISAHHSQKRGMVPAPRAPTGRPLTRGASNRAQQRVLSHQF